MRVRAHTHTHTHTQCKYSIHSHFQARNVTSLNVELEEMHKVNLRGYMIWLPHTTCFLFCLEDITNIHTDGSTQMSQYLRMQTLQIWRADGTSPFNICDLCILDLGIQWREDVSWSQSHIDIP